MMLRHYQFVGFRRSGWRRRLSFTVYSCNIASMKVYFSGSVYYRDDFIGVYEEIVGVLRQMGANVLEHTNKISADQYSSQDDNNRVENYRQVVRWVDQCDLAVVEASFPSTLHMSHEISLLLEKGKPVVALYQKGKEPGMFRAIKDDKIVWVEYGGIKDIGVVLKKAIEVARKSADVRFNFFVSPKILSYLDWVAKNRMVPRAVFLRELIEREMRKDREYIASGE